MNFKMKSYWSHFFPEAINFLLFRKLNFNDDFFLRLPLKIANPPKSFAFLLIVLKLFLFLIFRDITSHRINVLRNIEAEIYKLCNLFFIELIFQLNFYF